MKSEIKNLFLRKSPNATCENDQTPLVNCFNFLFSWFVSASCQPDEFKCQPMSSQCIRLEKVCDGVVDCYEGVDEVNCGKWHWFIVAWRHFSPCKNTFSSFVLQPINSKFGQATLSGKKNRIFNHIVAWFNLERTIRRYTMASAIISKSVNKSSILSAVCKTLILTRLFQVNCIFFAIFLIISHGLYI